MCFTAEYLQRKHDLTWPPWRWYLQNHIFKLHAHDAHHQCK